MAAHVVVQIRARDSGTSERFVAGVTSP